MSGTDGVGLVIGAALLVYLLVQLLRSDKVR
ncbi:potassium-transporting ATPase subunit F [Cellulomonas alba]|uniref:Potassium-transporting ATPase subunit F n=1 Tax=Cellulomonas alba TaxID=3053467 RepID=A0ABT7SBB5_9CELL|nr:potassium-transporting ATPase subunit F [Cellulomonas alba]MDM7853480.1 potassium-transporting ATPase subunit F [Cellulomonas alba]